MAMPYKAWRRMSESEREATRAQAREYLSRLDAL